VPIFNIEAIGRRNTPALSQKEIRELLIVNSRASIELRQNLSFTWACAGGNAEEFVIIDRRELPKAGSQMQSQMALARVLNADSHFFYNPQTNEFVVAPSP